MGRTACTEPRCLYNGALYLTVELYLYTPYGLYGLYRATVPVQECTLPLLLLTNNLELATEVPEEKFHIPTSQQQQYFNIRDF
jgi:hypothetical protein